MIKYIATKPQKKHSWFCPHHPSSRSNLSTPKYQAQSRSAPEGSSCSSTGAMLPAHTTPARTKTLHQPPLCCSALPGCRPPAPHSGPPGRVTKPSPSQTNAAGRSRGGEETQRLQSSICARATGSRKANRFPAFSWGGRSGEVAFLGRRPGGYRGEADLGSRWPRCIAHQCQSQQYFRRRSVRGHRGGLSDWASAAASDS